MSILGRPDFMDLVRKADGEGLLPEFLEAATRSVKRSNRARAKLQHNAQALEKLNRMRRARGLPPVNALS